MPNIYSKPISSGFRNTYQSQFVPLPLEQFAKTNELNQAKQDAEVQILNNTSDAAWKLKGIADADNEYINGIRSTVDNAASDLSNKDLTQRENQDAVRGLIKTISRDKDLNTIMANKAKYDEYQKSKEEAEKAGTYQAYNDNFIPSYNAYAKGGGYKSGKALDTTIHKYSEERPKIEEYFNNMGEDGADQLGKIGETYYKYGFEGVSKAKATNRAAQAFDSYLTTPEGQQGLRRFNYLKANNPSAVKGIKSPSEYVFNQFLDAGLERVHGKSTSGLAAALNDETKAKKEKEADTNLFAGTESTESPSSLQNGRKFEFDDKGQIKGSGQGFFHHMMKDYDATDPLKFIREWKNDSSLSEEENADAKHILTGAKLNGVTPQQYNEHFDKTWHAVVPKPLIGKALEQNNDAFRKEGSGLWSNIVLNNTKTGEKGLNFVDAVRKLADEKGLSLPRDPTKNAKAWNQALDDLGVRVTGAYAPNRNSARSIEIKIGGNTFAGDLTNGGTYMKGVSPEAQATSNLDKLNAGEQIIEKDSQGNDVIYFKSMTKKDKQGNYIIDHKVLKN
jgi:hypothetical protein